MKEFLENNIPSPDAKRIGTIRETRNEVLQNLPEEQKDDEGEIRKRISEILMEKDKTLSQEEREAIAKRAINRHIAKFEIGTPEIKGHLEALHAVPPTIGLIIKLVQREYPDMSREQIIELDQSIENEIDASQIKFPELLRSEIINEILEKNPTPQKQTILEIKKIFDERTGPIAATAARHSKSSLLIPRYSRLVVDMNRPIDNREISKKQSALEYGLGAKEVYWEVLRKLTGNACEVDQKDEITNPYLVLSIHGKVSKKTTDFVIANGLKNGEMACDPQIARWLEEKLKQKIREKNIVADGAELATVHIAEEGEKFSGDSHLIDYRYGDKKHHGFGQLLQIAQLEIDRRVRKASSEKISETLAEILQEFSSEFKDRACLTKFIIEHTSPEDHDRKQGVILVETAHHSSILEGEIGLRLGLRKALGVKPGDMVIVNGWIEYKVCRIPKELVQERIAVFSEKDLKEKILDQDVKIRKKINS